MYIYSIENVKSFKKFKKCPVTYLLVKNIITEDCVTRCATYIFPHQQISAIRV